jgi:hypothetical protein
MSRSLYGVRCPSRSHGRSPRAAKRFLERSVADQSEDEWREQAGGARGAGREREIGGVPESARPGADSAGTSQRLTSSAGCSSLHAIAVANTVTITPSARTRPAAIRAVPPRHRTRPAPVTSPAPPVPASLPTLSGGVRSFRNVPASDLSPDGTSRPAAQSEGPLVGGGLSPPGTTAVESHCSRVNGWPRSVAPVATHWLRWTPGDGCHGAVSAAPGIRDAPAVDRPVDARGG